tara:strand:+ start:974 stop:1207 length:234 start_codon:yes stop_codon:yes gene_type:complete
MTTQKPTFIRVQLSLIEKLLDETIQVAKDGDYAELAYIAGRVQGVIEGTISAVPQECFDLELTEAQQRLEERINDCV